jgi:hypothetical protein
MSPTAVPSASSPRADSLPDPERSRSPRDPDSSPDEDPIRTPLLHRLLLSLLPTVVLVGVAVSVIWGDSGLLVRGRLQQRLERANDEVAGLERDNQRILHVLAAMDRDPVVVERMVAEELGWAREGATVYRFEDATDKQPAPK